MAAKIGEYRAFSTSWKMAAEGNNFMSVTLPRFMKR
jgi:hypothetical protein